MTGLLVLLTGMKRARSIGGRSKVTPFTAAEGRSVLGSVQRCSGSV
jgi:hypothetical protein